MQIAKWHAVADIPMKTLPFGSQNPSGFILSLRFDPHRCQFRLSSVVMLPRANLTPKQPLRRRVLRAIRAPWYWVQKLVPKRNVEILSMIDDEEREERAKKEENEELFRFYADKKPPVSPYRSYFEKLSKGEKKEGDNKKANEKKDSIKKPSTSVEKQVKELEALAKKPFDPVKNAIVIDDDFKDGLARCGTLRRSWQYQARIRPRQKLTVPSVFLENGA